MSFPINKIVGAAVVADAVNTFIVGGVSDERIDSLQLCSYSRLCDTWKPCSVLGATNVMLAGAALVGDELIIVGGKLPNDDVSGRIMRVNVGKPSDSFSAIQSNSSIGARWGHAACSDGHDLVFIHGGFSNSKKHPCGDLFLYSASKDMIKGPFTAPKAALHSIGFTNKCLMIVDPKNSCFHMCEYLLLDKGLDGWKRFDVPGLSHSVHYLNVVDRKPTLHCWNINENTYFEQGMMLSDEKKLSGSWEHFTGTIPSVPNIICPAANHSIALIVAGDLHVFDPAKRCFTSALYNFVKQPLVPVPPSPVKAFPAAVAASVASRMLIRVGAQDDGSRSFSLRQKKQQNGGPAPPTNVTVDAIHPHDSQVAIQSSAVPVDVRMLCNYETDADDTLVKIEWVDVNRLVTVHIEQRLKIGLARQKRIDDKLLMLEEERGVVRQELQEAEDFRAELHEREANLDLRTEELKSYEKDLIVLKQSLVDEEQALADAKSAIARDRENLAKEIAAREEMERESDKRLRQEREAQKRVERELEQERKKDEKTREQLQRGIEANHNTERQLQREFEKIERERVQHKNEAEWNREKEDVWFQEKAQYERRVSSLSSDLETANKNLDIATYETKEARLHISSLEAENSRLLSLVEKYEGRMIGESDGEWSKRKDNNKRNSEQCKKGRYSTVGFAMDTCNGQSMNVIVDGGEPKCMVLDSISVVSNDTITQGFIQLEVGDGYTDGDSLSHILCNETTLDITASKGHVASSILPSQGRLVRFDLIPNMDVKHTVEAVLRGVQLQVASTSAAFHGVRTIEITVHIDGKKCQSICSGQCYVAVIQSPIARFKSESPYEERAAPLQLFNHVSLINPFADLIATKHQEQCAEAFLLHGVNGPLANSCSPDPKAAQLTFGQLKGLVCLRRGWSNLPTQVDERGIFENATIKVELEPVQEEDSLQYSMSEANQDALGSLVTVSTLEEHRSFLITINSLQATKNQVHAALNSLYFTSTAIPLEDTPRKVRFEVQFPSFRLPLHFTSTRSVPIINAAHEVLVSTNETPRIYYPHSTSVNDMVFPPPLLRLLDDVSVNDPYQSRFSGTITATINNPIKSKDFLSISVYPADKIKFSEEKNELSANDVVFCEVLWDSDTMLKLRFNTQTRAGLAEAALRSIVFSSRDAPSSTAKRISVESALGRGHSSTASLSVSIQPPVLNVAKLGGLKWTEHQGPVLATVQLGVTRTPEVFPLMIRVMILHGLEEGDEISIPLETPLENTSESLMFLGVDLASEVKNHRKSGGVDYYWLNDGSLLFRFTTMDSASKLSEILSTVTYFHQTANPIHLKKVLCARTVDCEATWSDALVPLSLVPVDDPTEIHDLHEQSMYYQGSVSTSRGFPISSTAKLYDPDTEDFVGGYLSIEPCSTFTNRDTLGLLSLESQMHFTPEFLVFLDESMRLFAFPSMEAHRQYEEALSSNIVACRNEDVSQFCIGYMKLEDADVDIEQELSRTRSSFAGSSDVLASTKSFVALPSLPSPEKWEAHFSPEVSRLIPLSQVEAVLRAFSFSNTSPNAHGTRDFTIRLGAGSLASYANVDGAELADQTVCSTQLRIAPPLLYLPNFKTHTTIEVGVQQLPFKSLTVPPVNGLFYKLEKSLLTATVVESTDDDLLTIVLRRGANDAPLELQQNNTIYNSQTKQAIGTVKSSRQSIDISFTQHVDAKALQTILRALAYERTSTTAPKKRCRRTVQVQLRDCLVVPVCDLDAANDTADDPAKNEAETSPPFVPSDSFPFVQAEFTIEGRDAPTKFIGFAEESVDHVLRSGPTRLFKSTSVTSTETILRAPSSVSIFLPPSSGPLSLNEDLHLNSRPASSNELAYIGQYNPPQQVSSPRKEKQSAPQTIVYNGYPVAILTQTTSTKGATYRIDCTATPPQVLADMLKKFSYDTSAKDKIGTRHVVKVVATFGDASCEAQVTLNVRPAYVDEIPKGSVVQYQAKPVFPLQCVKVRSPSSSFAGGRICVELSAQEGQRLGDHSIILVNNDKFEFQFEQEEAAKLIYREDGQVMLGNCLVTKTSLVIELNSKAGARDVSSVFSGEVVTALLRNSINVGVADPTLSADGEVNYDVDVSIGAADESSCSCSTTVVSQDKKKSIKKK